MSGASVCLSARSVMAPAPAIGTAIGIRSRCGSRYRSDHAGARSRPRAISSDKGFPQKQRIRARCQTAFEAWGRPWTTSRTRTDPPREPNSSLSGSRTRARGGANRGANRRIDDGGLGSVTPASRFARTPSRTKLSRTRLRTAPERSRVHPFAFARLRMAVSERLCGARSRPGRHQTAFEAWGRPSSPRARAREGREPRDTAVTRPPRSQAAIPRTAACCYVSSVAAAVTGSPASRPPKAT